MRDHGEGVARVLAHECSAFFVLDRGEQISPGVVSFRSPPCAGDDARSNVVVAEARRQSFRRVPAASKVAASVASHTKPGSNQVAHDASGIEIVSTIGGHMADEPTPTTLRRQLGAELRRLRTSHGWSIEDVASRVGMTPSTVSRMEVGSRTVSAETVERLITNFDLDSSDGEALRRLAASSRRRVRRSAVRDTDYVKIEQTGFVELERDAVKIREFNSGTVPGLLQTEKFMQASMEGTAPDVDEGMIRAAINVRKNRQQKLGSGVDYEVIVDEGALRRVVGGAETMIEQLWHLVAMIEKSVVAIQIIRFSSGAHPGASSQFVSLELPDGRGGDAVFSEGLFGHLEFRRAEDLQRFARVWDNLSARAASAELSTSIIISIMSNLMPEPDGEAHERP